MEYAIHFAYRTFFMQRCGIYPHDKRCDIRTCNRHVKKPVEKEIEWLDYHQRIRKKVIMNEPPDYQLEENIVPQHGINRGIGLDRFINNIV
jgi:hypothetical protein